jgi:cytochrome c553
MKKILKWAAIVLGTLVVIIGAAAFYLASSIDSARKKTYEVAASNLPIPSDSASIARGKYWAEALCTECHGTDYSGTEFFNEPDLGRIHAVNLTPGKGGIGGSYGDEDWIRAIRHAVRKTGHGIMIMPSENFYYLDDQDLSSMVAFLKTLPPVDQEWGEPYFTFMTKVIAGAGGFGTLYYADVIDHSKTSGFSAPPEGASAQYGEYLVKIAGCRSCHGKEMNGMEPQDPVSPFAPNLTPGGILAGWSSDDFLKSMRTGVKPDGKTIDPKFMPWLGIAKLNDEAIKAIYLYLQSLPGLPEAPRK